MAALAVGLAHGLVDVAPEHKLAPQQLDGAHRRRHNGAGAQALQQAGFGGGGAVALAGRQPVFGQGDGLGGQLGQHRVFPFTGELGMAELVGGEGDGGFGIRHAQQGFGQTHQGETFGAGNRVFLEQAFHGPERRRVGAHLLHPRRGPHHHAGPRQALQAPERLRQRRRLRLIGKRQTLARSLRGGRRDEAHGQISLAGTIVSLKMIR